MLKRRKSIFCGTKGKGWDEKSRREGTKGKGILQKRGGNIFRKSWHKRYVVLKEGSIYYYTSNRKNERCRGSYSINKSCTVRWCVSSLRFKLNFSNTKFNQQPQHTDKHSLDYPTHSKSKVDDLNWFLLQRPLEESWIIRATIKDSRSAVMW